MILKLFFPLISFCDNFPFGDKSPQVHCHGKQLQIKDLMLLEWVVTLRVSDQRCFVDHSEDMVQTEPKLHGVPLRWNKIFHSLQK